MNKICPICDKKYDADPQRLKHGRQTTCSRKCSYKLRSINYPKRKRVCDTKNKMCLCGKEFLGTERRKYCCRECFWSFYKPDEGQRVFHKYKCDFCDKEFKPRHPRTKSRVFCSRRCYEKQKSVDMAGSKNPMFGKSPKFAPRSWRQGWHWVGNKYLYFRSSWEISVAKYLESKGYDWTRFGRRASFEN